MPKQNPPQNLIDMERERLLRELEDLATTHERRRDIGDRLNEIGDTRPGVGVRSEDGLPDIEWLPVAPGGEIRVGGETYQVQPFYIAKYPVTFAQYTTFVEAVDGYNKPAWWQGMPKNYQRHKLVEQFTKSGNNPRDTVSWYQSVAFTRWLSQQLQGQPLPDPGNGSGQPLIIGQNVQVRLPTEWEWQWAAQGGGEQRPYPWGAWQDGCTNTYEAGLKGAIAVGMYRQGAAKCGALDMSGNLWEWCLNKYSKNEDWRMLRGGSFRLNSSSAVCTCRNHVSLPGSVNRDLGFRVVVSFPIAPADL